MESFQPAHSFSDFFATFDYLHYYNRILANQPTFAMNRDSEIASPHSHANGRPNGRFSGSSYTDTGLDVRILDVPLARAQVLNRVKRTDKPLPTFTPGRPGGSLAPATSTSFYTLTCGGLDII